MMNNSHIYNSYWDKFPEPTAQFHGFVASITSIIMLISLAGNFIVIFIHIRVKKLHSICRHYIISLACSNLSSPLLTYWMLIVSSVKQKWVFGDAGCQLYAFIQGYCALVSMTVFMVIALERAALIKTQQQQINKHRRLLLTIFIWVYPLPLAAAPLFGWGHYVLEGYKTTCCFDFTNTNVSNRSFIGFLFLFGFVIPVTTILLSYIRIVMHLCKAKALPSEPEIVMVTRNSDSYSSSFPFSSRDISMVGQSVEMDATLRGSGNLIHGRMFIVIFLIIFCFLLAWTPYATLTLVAQFGGQVHPLAVTLAGLLAKSSTTFNPIIYLCLDSGPLFRRIKCTFSPCYKMRTSAQRATGNGHN